MVIPVYFWRGPVRVHPLLDIAKSKLIRHLMINTNGVRIAKDRVLCDRLSQYMPEIEVYLQFDSFKAKAFQELRGSDLRLIFGIGLFQLVYIVLVIFWARS